MDEGHIDVDGLNVGRSGTSVVNLIVSTPQPRMNPVGPIPVPTVATGG